MQSNLCGTDRGVILNILGRDAGLAVISVIAILQRMREARKDVTLLNVALTSE